MKKERKKSFYSAVAFLSAFIAWTVSLRFIDVRAIGPNETKVGLSALNHLVHNHIGVNMTLYNITDWLGLLPIFTMVGFSLLGLFQWIKRKSILKVDYSIRVLGIFYLIAMAVYFLFEAVVINYRPILIGGYLEASYPSSTTMLVMSVMPTAIMQFNSRIKNKALKKFVAVLIVAFIVFMVVGRLLSGVHWLTDIIGGALFSIGLVMLYRCIC